jgi:hypothetical protein
MGAAKARRRIDREIAACYGRWRVSMRMIASLVAAAVVMTMSGVARGASCRAQLGAAKSALLVDRCKDVSPATHPPCNADNPCELIISEIKRGCDFFTEGGIPKAPAYCRNY